MHIFYQLKLEFKYV